MTPGCPSGGSVVLSHLFPGAALRQPVSRIRGFEQYERLDNCLVIINQGLAVRGISLPMRSAAETPKRQKRARWVSSAAMVGLDRVASHAHASSRFVILEGEWM